MYDENREFFRHLSWEVKNEVNRRCYHDNESPMGSETGIK